MTWVDELFGGDTSEDLNKLLAEAGFDQEWQDAVNATITQAREAAAKGDRQTCKQCFMQITQSVVGKSAELDAAIIEIFDGITDYLVKDDKGR